MQPTLENIKGEFLDCLADGFVLAMVGWGHSFICTAKLASPLMQSCGKMFAISYYGTRKTVLNQKVKGPVKGSLETTCRYLATLFARRMTGEMLHLNCSVNIMA